MNARHQTVLFPPFVISAFRSITYSVLSLSLALFLRFVRFLEQLDLKYNLENSTIKYFLEMSKTTDATHNKPKRQKNNTQMQQNYNILFVCSEHAHRTPILVSIQKIIQYVYSECSGRAAKAKYAGKTIRIYDNVLAENWRCALADVTDDNITTYFHFNICANTLQRMFYGCTVPRPYSMRLWLHTMQFKHINTSWFE